jgi:2Fe-2S ferredoxin
MIQVTFTQPDGQTETFASKPGDTLMDVAYDNGVAGIQAQCGGGCTCCTCHCWIAAPWLEKLQPPHKDELDILEYAWGRAANSRLACQVALCPELDGLQVEVPEQQS